MGDHQGGGDHGGRVVLEVGLERQLAQPPRLAGLEVVRSLARPAGVEAWLLAVQLLLLELRGPGIPVADLAVEPLLDGPPDSLDARPGDLGHLGEVRRGEVGGGPASRHLVDAGAGPVGVDSFGDRPSGVVER
jgi:hypothetical protein